MGRPRNEPNNSKKVKDLPFHNFPLNVTHTQTVYNCSVSVLEEMKRHPLSAASQPLSCHKNNDTVFQPRDMLKRHVESIIY